MSARGSIDFGNARGKFNSFGKLKFWKSKLWGCKLLFRGKSRKIQELTSKSCVISWNPILVEILAFRVLSSELSKALLSARGSVVVVSSQGKSNFTRKFKFWKYAGKCFKNLKKIFKTHESRIKSVRKRLTPYISEFLNFCSFWPQFLVNCFFKSVR